jgi:hypothetical protein
MTIEEILHIGKGLDAVDPGEEQSRRDFADACRRVDSARIEQQRIRDLADSIDEGDARYQRAIVALEEGNFVSAGYRRSYLSAGRPSRETWEAE